MQGRWNGLRGTRPADILTKFARKIGIKNIIRAKPVETGEHNVTPFIYGGLVVWQRFRGESESDIILLDLSTGVQEVIGAGGRQESRPSVSEDYVIWRVSETCDAGGFPRFRELFRGRVPTGIYAYDLRTGELRRLSRDKEPGALLSGNVALVTEGCQWITRQYAVLLD